MAEIITKYFSYGYHGKPYVLFRAMFEKAPSWGDSLMFIDEEVFDRSLGKWIHRADTVHRAWILGDSDLDFLTDEEAREFFDHVPSRTETLIERASAVTKEKSMVIDYPLGRWADQRQHFPYLQTIKNPDGNWLVEICGNKFLVLQYTAIQRKHISELGFSNPNGRKSQPNFWKLLPAETTPEQIAKYFHYVLALVFELGQEDNFYSEFPVPEYFQPAED